MGSIDKDFQVKTKKESPRELAQLLVQYLKKNSCILDLGAGAGVDSFFFVRNGHKVIAIDRETSVLEEFISKNSDTYFENINVIKDDFYKIKLPSCDVIYASYSIPFCKTDEFQDKWKALELQVGIGTIIAIVFFGKKDDWNALTERFTFHSAKDVEHLLKNYEILHIEDREYEGTSLNQKREIVKKHWNVIDVIAKKCKG